MRALLPMLGLGAVLTTAGKQWMIDKVQDVAPNSNARMEYGAWGTGTTPENVNNTSLAIEASEARVLGVLSQPTADTDRLIWTHTANGSKSVTECGRFNQSAVGGVMLCRALFGLAIPMALNDSIQFTFDVQQT